MVKSCKNCGQILEDLFCPHCGQKASTTRFTFSHLLKEFLHGFYHFEHGLLFTTKELALRPGQTIRNYLSGKRISYFNPFTFLLVFGGINAFLLKKLHWQSFFIELGMLDKNIVDQQIWDSSLEHFTIRLLFAIPIYSLVSYFMYFKNRYSLAEHILANTYIRGEINFFMILVEPLLFISSEHSILMIAKFVLLVLLILYAGWSYSGLFGGKSKTISFSKGLLTAIIATSLELIALNAMMLKRIPDHLF